jgi:hypothetical protein
MRAASDVLASFYRPTRFLAHPLTLLTEQFGQETFHHISLSKVYHDNSEMIVNIEYAGIAHETNLTNCSVFI